MNLDGKRILITGGGSGIGLELARRLAGSNHVVIAGRDPAKLEEARSGTPSLRTLTLDVTSEDQARSGMDWLNAELGGLDLLVNNAGVMRGYAIADPESGTASTEDVEINLVGPIRMTRLAVPLLETAPQGAVLFVSSAVALGAVPGMAVYAATKAAVHSLARSLRAELAGRVRVFEVLPPWVDTAPAGDLGVSKIAPAEVAEGIVEGLRRDHEEIRVGRVRQLATIARLSPGLADRLLVQGLRPTPHT